MYSGALVASSSEHRGILRQRGDRPSGSTALSRPLAKITEDLWGCLRANERALHSLRSLRRTRSPHKQWHLYLLSTSVVDLVTHALDLSPDVPLQTCSTACHSAMTSGGDDLNCYSSLFVYLRSDPPPTLVGGSIYTYFVSFFSGENTNVLL